MQQESSKTPPQVRDTAAESGIVDDQWERYTYLRDNGHVDYLVKADRCEKFFAGDQWEDDDIKTLRSQKRPALTVNKIASTLATVFGEQVQNRAEVLFRPASGAPGETAEALTKVWMQIAQNNQLPWTRSEVFSDGCIRSRGFYDVRMKFDDNMMGEVSITQLNSKNVLIDADAESYDPDTWADVFISKWLSSQDIAVLYDEDSAERLKIEATTLSPYGYDQIERVRDRFAQSVFSAGRYEENDPAGISRNIRVLERQHRKLDKQEHFVDISNGDTRPIPADWDRNRIASVLERMGGQIAVTKKLIKRIRWTVTAGNLVLHDEWSPYKHFTPVPFFPTFRYGRTIGLVEHLVGSQELLNKTLSQELHVINTSANSGWKVKAGSLINMSIDQLAQQGATTGLVLELDDINGAEKIQPNQTPSGLDRVSYKAEEHIKSISGVSDSLQGFDRPDVAAKAIAYKTQRGAQNFTKVMDNLERTDWLLARNVLDLVQQYYTEERVINITHDDPSRQAETMTVNQPDPVTGSIQNDLTLGEYDIVITSQPFRATLEDSQFEQARALREIGVQIPDAVLIENSRLNRKAEIIKQMTGDMESPQAQKQQELQMRQQEAEVMTAEADAQKKQADAQLSLARAEEISMGGDGGAEMQKAEMEQRAMEQEMELERQRFEMERWKMEQEFALKREQMEQEFAIKREQMEQEMRIEEQRAEQEARLQEKQAQQQMLHERMRAARETAAINSSNPNQTGE
jgi:hypothetical protein